MATAELLLTSFCSNLLGETSKEERKAKSRDKKLKNLKGGSNHFVIKTISGENSDQSHIQNEPNNLVCDFKTLEDPQVTDDGFKIISEIPPDDSDVSDAFESDDEDIESSAEVAQKICNKKKETDDGFKIINEIPPDDSDVDDAFESDLDEEEWAKEAQTRIQANDSNNNNDKNNRKPVLEKLKKPLLGLIQDFGMEDKIYLNENLKPTIKRSKCEVKNKKSNRKRKARNTLTEKELEVMDHSCKRGKKRKQTEEPLAQTEAKKISKKDSEDAFKKTRYEIYKLGISHGTQVEKKQAKIDLVVKLGAKPRKDKPMNYKSLIKLRKEQKEEEKIEREETKEMGMPVKKKPVIKSKVKDQVDINPAIGTFRGGVLKLSKKDIETINK